MPTHLVPVLCLLVSFLVQHFFVGGSCPSLTRRRRWSAVPISLYTNHLKHLVRIQIQSTRIYHPNEITETKQPWLLSLHIGIFSKQLTFFHINFLCELQGFSVKHLPPNMHSFEHHALRIAEDASQQQSWKISERRDQPAYSWIKLLIPPGILILFSWWQPNNQ